MSAPARGTPTWQALLYGAVAALLAILMFQHAPDGRYASPHDHGPVKITSSFPPDPPLIMGVVGGFIVAHPPSLSIALCLYRPARRRLQVCQMGWQPQLRCLRPSTEPDYPVAFPPLLVP